MSGYFGSRLSWINSLFLAMNNVVVNSILDVGRLILCPKQPLELLVSFSVKSSSGDPSQ